MSPEKQLFLNDAHSVDTSYHAYWDQFQRIREQYGFTEKYEKNDRCKKTIHSFRLFCYAQCKLATGDVDYAHAYIGHSRYLAQYDRLTEQQKIEHFKRCIHKLSIY